MACGCDCMFDEASRGGKSKELEATYKTDWQILLGPFEKELEEVARIFEQGAKKYSRNGWKFIKNPQDIYTNSLLRHVMTVASRREKNDPESGMSHKAHAIANLLILMSRENGNE